MPSHSRALEASFEPSDKQAVPLDVDAGPALEDFDSFFEKLNKLEPPEWRKAHPANPEPPLSAAATAHPVSKPAAKKPAAPNPGTKADPLAGLRAAMAQARLHVQQEDAARKPGRMRGKLPGAFKFALTALVLFAVGMGIGWAALSLPGKLGDTPATASAPAASAPVNGLIVESKADALLLAAPAAKLSDTPAAVVPLSAATPGTAASKTETAPHPDSALPVDLAAAKAAGAQNAAAHGASGQIADAEHAKTSPADTKDVAATDGLIALAGTADAMAPAAGSASAPAATDPAKAQPKRAAAKAKPAKLPPLVSLISSAPPETKPPGSNTESPASSMAGSAHYAVQVGACRSTQCVDNYRKLIAAQMPTGMDRIRVVAVAADGKDTGVQRVRVAPLDKAAAQQLRAALIQADPRLGAAYVVEFRP